MKNPKLPLIEVERSLLRKAKIKFQDIHKFEPTELASVLNGTIQRANELIGLADFQQVPSIGLKLAEKIVYHLRIYSLREMKEKDGAKLLDELEVALGVWTDPCVEDQLRCVIHYANHPDSNKQWFHFTEERKAFRSVHGYPRTRPSKAWYESEA